MWFILWSDVELMILFKEITDTNRRNSYQVVSEYNRDHNVMLLSYENLLILFVLHFCVGGSSYSTMKTKSWICFIVATNGSFTKTEELFLSLNLYELLDKNLKVPKVFDYICPIVTGGAIIHSEVCYCDLGRIKI